MSKQEQSSNGGAGDEGERTCPLSWNVVPMAKPTGTITPAGALQAIPMAQLSAANCLKNVCMLYVDGECVYVADYRVQAQRAALASNFQERTTATLEALAIRLAPDLEGT